MEMPSLKFPRGVAAASVPMKLHSIVLKSPLMRIPLVKPKMARPRTFVSAANISRPFRTLPAPVISIIGVGRPLPQLAPCCVKPLIVTGFVICGSGELSVMVFTPPTEILNAIELRKLKDALASSIAFRKLPGPPSFVFVTVKTGVNCAAPFMINAVTHSAATVISFRTIGLYSRIAANDSFFTFKILLKSSLEKFLVEMVDVSVFIVLS